MVRRHTVAAYLVLALGRSWSVEVSLALAGHGVLRSALPDERPAPGRVRA
jgi:hypothetical protein